MSTAAARDEGSKERKRSKGTNGNPCPSRRNKSTQKTEYSLLPVATAFLSNEQTSMAVTNSKVKRQRLIFVCAFTQTTGPNPACFNSRYRRCLSRSLSYVCVCVCVNEGSHDLVLSSAPSFLEQRSHGKSLGVRSCNIDWYCAKKRTKHKLWQTPQVGHRGTQLPYESNSRHLACLPFIGEEEMIILATTMPFDLRSNQTNTLVTIPNKRSVHDSSQWCAGARTSHELDTSPDA